MRRYLRSSAASAIVIGLLPLQALAQQAAQTAASDGAQTPNAVVAQAAPSNLTGPVSPKTQSSPIGIAPNLNQNTPGQSLRPVDTATTTSLVRTGLFPDVGNTLINNGVEFHGVLTDHFLANPDAGNRPGYGSNLLSLRPEVDFDLGKILGLTGGSIHTGATFFISKNNLPGIISQTGGISTGYQTTPISESNLLTRLTYEQKLLQDRLDIEIGRANPHQFFFIPNSIDPFSTDSPAIYADGDINSFPYAVYGGKATYHLSPFWYVQAGAFEDDYRDETKQGWKFGDSRASGANILAELGYRSEFSNAQYPANLEAGFEWATRTGYSNTKGTGQNATTATTATDYPGGGVVFWQGAKVIYRAPGSTATIAAPPQNIQIYGQADIAVDQPQPISADATVGVNFTGFVPYRPADTFEIQGRAVQLSSVEAGFETKEHTLLNRGRYVQQSKTGYVFETDYQFTLGPYATLTAYGEYYVHPDDYEVPFVNHVPAGGAIAGVILRLSLGPILGTSNKPF